MDSYKNTDTDSLIITVRRAENADDAFSELVERYMPLIEKRVSVISVPKEEHAEAVQEAIVALHNAVLSYDKEKYGGVTFGLFAGVCISNRLTDYVRKRARQSEMTDAFNAADNAESGIDIESSVAARDICERVMSAARNVLSELEFRVFCLSFEGWSVKAIAAKLSVTPKSVENARLRLRRKLTENKDVLEFLNNI